MKTQKDLEAYLFHEGTNYNAQEYLGGHKEGGLYVFRVWAPNAEKVFLTGDFNGWDESIRLHKITLGGVWETSVDEKRINAGQKYKYKIYGRSGASFKADPYATRTEKMPETASVIPNDCEYIWHDKGWLDFRRKMAANYYGLPMNVYELHLSSFRRHKDGTPFDYTELARELAPYVKQMGYTHVQIMPIAEYPYDASWGYQICSFFAPTARYGSTEQFKGFVDKMHEAGVGVILDWSLSGFPKDEHGLYRFDGDALYERTDISTEGIERFDFSRNEVRSFLISSALYWLREFHIDALRIGGLSSAIHGGGAEFIKTLNYCIKNEFCDVLTIAELSDPFAKTTGFDNGGLGFDIKWDMEWTDRTLRYAGLDGAQRATEFECLASPTVYAFGERRMLPISHDEVVHGRRSFLDKMSGDYWQKFAGARAVLGYMMTYPAKKLNFMGYEIGHFREWDYDGEVEWFLLEYQTHAKFQRFVAELNHFYLSEPSLWQNDASTDGFVRIETETNSGVISYKRVASDNSSLTVAINLSLDRYEGALRGDIERGEYEELFNSDDERFGGKGEINPGALLCDDDRGGGSLRIRLAPLAFTVIKKK